MLDIVGIQSTKKGGDDVAKAKEKSAEKGTLLKRVLPDIFKLEDIGDFLEGQFNGTSGDGAYKTFLFTDGKGKQWAIWNKIALAGVLDQMMVGNIYRVEYVSDIKTGSGRRVKEIEVRDLS